jgi:flavodoxin
MKVGLVYYSRTGNTRQVAKTLEEKLKQHTADVDRIEIEHVKKPSFFKAGKAGTKQLELPMKPAEFDMGKYDIIVAGFPTWNKRPSPFMKSFFGNARNIKGKKVAIFSTGLSPLNARETFKEVMKQTLENAEVTLLDSFLAVRFTRGKLVDGAQNIDVFLQTVLDS